MTRHAPAVLLTGLAFATGAAVATAASSPTDDTPPPTATDTDTVTVAPAPLAVADLGYQGHTARWWALRARSWHRHATALRYTLLHRGSVTEALDLACTIYGGCATLWRRARCESTLDPGAVNGQGADSPAGLLQFKPSTWATTPYRRFSIFSAYANALAAGWMISVAHRGSEWACR